MQIRCLVCGSVNSKEANYCSHCGNELPQKAASQSSVEGQPRFQWGCFWLVLLGTLLFTAVSVWVLDAPVFLFGLFLPWIWSIRPKTRS